ncbi:MAG: hypothetical protein K0S12_1492 [Bacteroidetes bacterium]|jgi:hypothetical protein|nr:hypothetical protein [Bacteroidota bacterium]
MKRVLFLFLLSSFFVSYSQRGYRVADHYNGWYMYFGDHKLSEKWGIRLEAQWRRNNVILHPQQLLLRTGINYHFNKNAFATLGYCYVVTHPYGDFPSGAMFPENRIWEQFQLKHQISSLETVHRIRLEQRFVNAPVRTVKGTVPGPAVYSNRLRYLYRVSIPFSGSEIKDNSFYLSVYDEIFLGFSNTIVHAFDQNRAYISLGYKIPKAGRLEIGYLNQLILKSDGIRVENNHTLQVSLTSSIPFFRQKK